MKSIRACGLSRTIPGVQSPDRSTAQSNLFAVDSVAGLFDVFAEVGGLNFNQPAHFIKPGAQRDAKLVERSFNIRHWLARGHAEHFTFAFSRAAPAAAQALSKGKRGGNQR